MTSLRSTFVLVIEAETSRLQIFTFDGRFVTTVDGFKDVSSLAQIENFVFITDTAHGVIQKLEIT